MPERFDNHEPYLCFDKLLFDEAKQLCLQIATYFEGDRCKVVAFLNRLEIEAMFRPENFRNFVLEWCPDYDVGFVSSILSYLSSDFLRIWSELTVSYQDADFCIDEC